MPRDNTSSLDSIGYCIRELRLQKGLTQADLARLVGCAQNTIAEWENRKGRAPGKKLLSQVAQALEVSLDSLLGIGKIEKSQIPCYGGVLSEGFVWSNNKEVAHYIEVPPSEYCLERFALKILDDLLEPTVYKSDYGIFEKLSPEDGDIVIAHLLMENKAMIRKWRQEGLQVMLSEVNPARNYPPYFFKIIETDKSLTTYTIKKQSNDQLVVEGKLVAVKRVAKSTKNSSNKISYIFY